MITEFLLKVFAQDADNLFGLKFKTSASVLYMSNEADQIVQAVMHLKKRWLMSQPVSSYQTFRAVYHGKICKSIFASSIFQCLKAQTAATKKILPKDVPGTLLNMVSFVLYNYSILDTFEQNIYFCVFIDYNVSQGVTESWDERSESSSGCLQPALCSDDCFSF